ncbi:MAG TPA: VTT domain-containing protein [Vicinamibacterales bacterium]|nr:VTT domain-containing protein [Vicinamibacterales bacterium]
MRKDLPIDYRASPMRWTLLWILLIGLILVPFFLFEPQFNDLAAALTEGTVSRWLVAGGILALLSLDVLLPVPSSVVSTAAGVLLGFWQGAAIVWLGMMVGCLFGYALGSRGSAAAGRLVGPESLARAGDLMKRYGDLTIVLCRPVPVLAEASVVFAGLVRAPVGRVVRLTALSNLGIALGYSAFGAFSMRLDSFLVAFVGALLLPGLALLLSRLTLK